MPESETCIDVAALESSLSSELETPVADTEVLHDGLNLSIAISTEEQKSAYVLRRPNEIRKTDLFNGVQQEFEIMRCLAATRVPIPDPILYCDDTTIVGDEFIVIEYVDGAGIEWGDGLPERFQTSISRTRIAHLLVDTLADLHSVDTGPFDGVCDRVTPREVVETDLERIDGAAAATGHDVSRLRAVGERLRDEAPENSTLALCHGDYKPDNVFFASEGEPDIAAVADWETATLGDPLTDLGYLLFFWREADDPGVPPEELDADLSPADREAILQRNEQGFWPFTSAPGSPSRQDLVRRYEAHSGISYENDRYYRAHAAFVLAAIWEDLTRVRVDDGAEPGSGAHVEYAARLAEQVLDGRISL